MYLEINKCVTAVKFSNFSVHYLRNRSTLVIVFWVISVYFNIRNTLPKSGTFLLGHPVYVDGVFYVLTILLNCSVRSSEEEMCVCVCVCVSRLFH